MKKILFSTFLLLISFSSYSQQYEVTTLAGRDKNFEDGPATTARFNYPNSICNDAYGNVFVTDSRNHRIRKISTSGLVTTLAGSKMGYLDGIGTEASFNWPAGIAVDASGNLYVADCGNHRIRKITASGVVTTFAGSGNKAYKDGNGIEASFNWPAGIALDSSGTIYVADAGNHRIRKITPGGIVTTLAGSGNETYADGSKNEASFRHPTGIAVNAFGNIYVADQFNQRIRKITTEGFVSTFAGSGAIAYENSVGSSASFRYPIGLAVDISGNVYVADFGNNRIRKITAAGVVTTFAGFGNGSYADGVGIFAYFSEPHGVSIDALGNLYVADSDNNRIRKITAAGVVTTLAGCENPTYTDGFGTKASFKNPYGIAIDASGNIYVADNGNNRIRKITADGIVTTLAGSGDSDYADGSGTSASFHWPEGVAVDAFGNVFVVDTYNKRIRKITASGVVSTHAGSGNEGFVDGIGSEASFDYPCGIALDSSGNIYVADAGNHRIRKITASGLVTTFAGSGKRAFANGYGTKASFNWPTDVTVDAFGNVYVSDAGNNRIRKISTKGKVTTIAGSGKEGYKDGNKRNASFNSPTHITLDTFGNLYVTEESNHRIRKISTSGMVTTVAGSGKEAYKDGIGTDATFALPEGIAVDAIGNIYVADSWNNRIRKITIK